VKSVFFTRITKLLKAERFLSIDLTFLTYIILVTRFGADESELHARTFFCHNESNKFSKG